MTNTIASFLAGVGEHWGLFVIAGLELVWGVSLVAAAIYGRQERKEKRARTIGAGRSFLQAWSGRPDEVCIVVRNEDRLPFYAAGDIKRLLGVELEELQADFAKLSKTMEDPKEFQEGWNQYLNWDGASVFERSWKQKSGGWIRVCLWREQSGTYDLLSFRIDTDYHRQMEQYEDLVQKAQEASDSKTSFLSRMSHEIRTPMNGIQGLLKLAQDRLDKNNENDSQVSIYLEKAQELSDHQLALINDILDMSRIEAGKVELEKKQFSLKALKTKLYDMFARNLEARGIRYEVNFEEVTVDGVIGDELRISQVIINFLSNAVKFTTEGEIIVTFRQMMLQGGMVDLMIRVHDTGIGMEPEFINRIFRPFEQESIETGKKYGGSGLGMAITDQLVRLMGGEIVVESVPGQGSDFSVFLHLPVAEMAEEAGQQSPEAAEKEVDPKEAFRGRRILLAEDNEINAMIAEELLSRMGARVEIAENGQAAVDQFGRHEAGYYDYILMDVQMPVMDGRTAARTIRALDRSDAGDIPIFALSADAFVEDERLSRKSGMNGHYAKPVDYDVLGRGILEFFREKEARKGMNP